MVFLKFPADISFSEHIQKSLHLSSSYKTEKLILLGASGSIGKSTLSFLEKQDEIELSAFSVHTSIGFIYQFLKKTKKSNMDIAITSNYDKKEFQELRSSFPQNRFYLGMDGMIKMIESAASRGADTVLTAVVGSIGITATIRTIELGLKLALANKESLVTAGPVIRSCLDSVCTKPTQEVNSSLLPSPFHPPLPSSPSLPSILPVDSEHNSILRVGSSISFDSVRKVILPASGGPLLHWKEEDIAFVSKEEVLAHPNWSMGPKISVDSAGMINKGLEIIEAHYLFSLPYEMLDAWIHPCSLVHSILELSDGSYFFHASSPDMLFPIAHSLCFPNPPPFLRTQEQTPLMWNPLDFQSVLEKKYPGFFLCLEAGREGGTAPSILNAANEEAVRFFLEGRIDFIKIPDLIRSVLDQMDICQSEELEIFLEADRKAREEAKKIVETNKLLSFSGKRAI